MKRALTAADIPFSSNPPMPADWQLMDDVQVMNLPNPAYMVESMIQERSIGAIVGPSGVGKSSFLAALLVSIATKRNFFGHQVLRGGHSISVAAEDAIGFKRRLADAKRAAHLSLAQKVGVHTFPTAINLRERSECDRLVSFIESHRIEPLVICFDTYPACTPGADENSAADTTTTMSNLASVRDSLGCAVLIVHHTNASGSRERGHSAMRGALDTMITLTPVDDVVQVECGKQRNDTPFEAFKLKLVPLEDGTGCVFRSALDVLPTDTLSPIQRQVLTVLEEAGRTGLTKSEWKQSVNGVQERSFYRAIERLQQDGYVRQTGTHFRCLTSTDTCLTVSSDIE